MSGLVEIKKKLEAFKKRYYSRQVVLGSIAFLIINSVFFLGISGLENQFWLGTIGRSLLFFSFLILILGSFFFLVIKPLLVLMQINGGLSDQEAADEISKHFSEIEDKLLNTIQLSSQDNNEFITAAIEKKSESLRRISFLQAVDYKPVKNYSIILLLVAFGFSLASFINPSLISESPKRIVNFKKEFAPEAPFSFELLNDELKGYRGEDFVLRIQVVGDQIPESAIIDIEGESSPRSIKIVGNNSSYTFLKLQENRQFHIEAAGFKSRNYTINVNDRPDLVSMFIHVAEPQYTGGKRRTIENTGDLILLEGSTVLWEICALATDSASFRLNKDNLEVSRLNESLFAVEQRIFEGGGYNIDLYNEFSKNKSALEYSIDVVKDQYPEIIAEYFPDSVAYQAVTLAGSISDDYGFSNLFINYRLNTKDRYRRIPLEITRDAGSQSYFAHWNLDTLQLSPGESMEIYMSVIDNDQVNGPKETKANSFILKAPTEDEINSLISDKQDGVEEQLDNSQFKAEDIAERLEALEEKLKSEQKFDWQEKKLLNDVIEDREKLAEDIEKLRKQHQELLKANEQFQKQSPQTQEKNQRMQELLDQLMDEETKELYDKLKELMKENAQSDEISQQLNQLKKSEQNLERDLERALELFKRLKMESALEQNLQKLDTLSQQQEQVMENEEGLEGQEKINEEFDDFREKMDEVQKLNQELKRPEAMEDFELEERQIAKELREIADELQQENESQQNHNSENNSNDQTNEEQGQEENGDNQQQNQNSGNQKPSQKSKQKQKSAAQKMKNLSKKLSNMQGGMQMEMMQANLDQLRDILDNLVKLSFNQEEIMLEMREVNQSDPRFLELSQNQLKLKDDAKVIQDSLLSLASKVVQISSFITREVGSINDNIDEAIDYLKDRNRSRAITSQQFAMTSINNLALLLDDTMQQMQMSMSEAMGNSSSGQKKQNQGLPDLQELQNQLGEKINELKGSGKSGRQLSEELARLAAEQEMIRRQLQMLKEAQDGKPGGGLGGEDMQRAIQMMEQNEVDLVNKRLTRQLINRQKQITTRMLEAEKAQRNQEMDEEREADRPSAISREIPPGFEKYLELKKKEVELLKTIPIELNQFYKKEVNDYFRRLSSDKEND